MASSALAAISKFPAEDLSPHSLPPALLTLLEVDLEQCGSELTLSGEQLIIAAVTSPAHPAGITSLVQAVLERELPAPRGAIYTALQQAKSLTAVERELRSTWSQLKTSTQQDPLGLAITAELIRGAGSPGPQFDQSAQLRQVWKRALFSVKDTPLLSAQGVEQWRMLAGFSVPTAWSSFTTALVNSLIEVSDLSLGGAGMWVGLACSQEPVWEGAEADPTTRRREGALLQ